jgi:hypothetical protein
MGNNPSQAIAAASAKQSFSGAMKDVNQQLGLGGGEAKDDVKVPAAIGCANKKEQQQRHKDRQIEYEMKQKERMERKGALESKWASSAAGTTTSKEDGVDEEKDKELKAKLAAMKEQYGSTAKDKKPKKSGFFGSKK